MFGVAWGANQFSSLLLADRLHRGLSESTADALFGVYAIGLIPALLLIGPISDQRGRRPFIVAAGVLSALASLALTAGTYSLGMLYLGRFLAGVCGGAAFAAGTAWIKELSVGGRDRRRDADARGRARDGEAEQARRVLGEAAAPDHGDPRRGHGRQGGPHRAATSGLVAPWRVSRGRNSAAPGVVTGGCCAKTQDPMRSSAT
jgi:Major Facilitator Superfamily